MRYDLDFGILNLSSSSFLGGEIQVWREWIFPRSYGFKSRDSMKYTEVSWLLAQGPETTTGLTKGI